MKLLNHPRAISAACLMLIALIGAASDSPKTFSVADFGAVGDGKTLNTAAIQALIDQVSAKGGGTVVIPAGKFLSGAIFFKPGVNLHIEKDGVLLGSTRPSDYPQIDTRWEGVERRWTSAFLNFDHMSNVTVDGEGMVDGQGDIWMSRGGFGRRGGGTRPSFAQGPATFPSTRPGGNMVGRPRLICFSNCDNVRIADLHLQKQAVWCLHILYSHDVVIENLDINAIARIPSSDGMDIDSSRNVTIIHCSIACNDDDIAIKSGKDADGRRVNIPSENITITDCTIGAGGGIAMGSEVSGGIRHVLVQGCTMNGTDAGPRFKSQPSRGGVVEDITFRDMTENNVMWMIDGNLAWRMVGPNVPPADPLTVVRDVHFENIHGTARTGGSLHGLKGGPFENVTFTNCNVTAQAGIRVENADHVDFTGLNLKVAQGPAVINPTTQP